MEKTLQGKESIFDNGIMHLKKGRQLKHQHRKCIKGLRDTDITKWTIPPN